MLLFKVLFYCFALILVYAAIRVVTARSPMTAVLHLVLTFLMTSCLWMLLEAEFLALSLVIIYCGAVMVFFLFAVMMLDIPYDTVRDGFARFFPIGVFVAILVIVEMAVILTDKTGLFAVKYPGAIGATGGTEGTAGTLGHLLYTYYLYSFEVVGLILLVALIAAISLTKSTGPLRRKDISVSAQIKADPTKRVRLIPMKTSKMAEYKTEEETTEAEGQKEDQ